MAGIRALQERLNLWRQSFAARRSKSGCPKTVTAWQLALNDVTATLHIFRVEVVIQLRHLTTFAAVAETLNFTRAAERVHLSQSSVTEQIQALETDLGTKLFDGSRRKLTLTPAGLRLIDDAAELLKLAKETHSVVAEAGEVVSGRLVIGALETLCVSRLPKLLAEFHRRFPMVELDLKTADSGALRSGVKSGVMDVAFVF
ncbi:LysR family transcriptional regulator [Rhizobium sp. 21-4511-3d]